MSSDLDARAALADIQKVTRKPVSTVIYTHTHPDHIGGAAVLAPDAAQVIARRLNVPTFGKSELINEIGMVRGAWQWGFGLNPEEIINIGADPACARHYYYSSRRS